MTLIVDCLVNKGILIGADCKMTDEKFHKFVKTQKIFPFQNKDKISFTFCSSGFLCIHPKDVYEWFSAEIRPNNINSCLKQLAFDNLKSFKDKNIILDHTEGCYLMLFYYHNKIPYQSRVIFNYESEKILIDETNQLINGSINSNLIGEEYKRFYQLIRQNLSCSQILNYSLQTKEPISYENGQKLVQWTIENYSLRYPDIRTGSGIQMGILKHTQYEWIRKDFEK
ncbi:MAG: hypothetical protein ACXADY_02850 [Candidatus Hodarchaeales archaeon]|jgi:hypothetical protein